MKKLVTLLILLVYASLPVAYSGCANPPSARVQQVTTLKIAGETAKSAVILGGQLLRDGRITDAQAITINRFYDEKFQPAFRLAVIAARSDLSSVASPDLMNLCSELSALVARYQNNR